MSRIPNQKAYHGVLEQIRIFIHKNLLKPGDKLPSERELAETLGMGRSSVREALRALELLGIIETRKGEGTFLGSYRPFQTVEILASFILGNNSTKDDIIATRKLIEKEAAKLAIGKLEDKDIIQFKKIIHDLNNNPKQMHIDFFSLLLNKTENELLLIIWQLMMEFSQTFDNELYESQFYQQLVHLYTKEDYSLIENLFMKQLFS
ncbi:FadR/GntR family transcriptional regulator [Oceanobacillus sp. Castelsardo]|uniref:FadR/GntR family transcriptional regulator n=1 Tax=Oceanobacillus sp. Castelsardo TaxID=1851204 RepID=UPI0008385D99|nr:GntR family transcriptional regulator [Oceanobacillus sp. Castelsardo]